MSNDPPFIQGHQINVVFVKSLLKKTNQTEKKLIKFSRKRNIFLNIPFGVFTHHLVKPALFLGRQSSYISKNFR